MASPHAAGVAVLTRQAHPRKSSKSLRWNVREWKAAIINTGGSGRRARLQDEPRRLRARQPALSTKTQAVAFSEKGLGVSLNFGYAELKEDYSETLTLKIENLSPHSGTFNISSALPSGSPHSVSFDETSFVVPGESTHFVDVTLNVAAATAGVSNGPGLSFNEVAGLVLVTPQGSEFNSGIALRVPYYLVPRALSDIRTKLGSKLKPSNPTTTANVTNEDGVIPGDADFYAWGLSDGKEAGKAVNDVRAIGVQSFPFNATNQFIGFSVNTYDRWSNPSTNEYDIYVDVNNDGIDDYIVIGVDQGAVQTGTFNGRLGLVRLQHQKRRREHQLLRAGADGQRGGEHLRPLDPALSCRRAVPERGEPALHVPRDLVRRDGDRSPGRGRGLGEVQRLGARHLDRWVPDGRSGRYRSGDDRRQRNRVGTHARARSDDHHRGQQEQERWRGTDDPGGLQVEA